MLNKQGQSILEVILAMAIFSLIAAAMVVMVTGSFTALNQGGEHTEAEALAQEAIEAIRSIRDGAWNELVYTTSSISISGNEWIFDGEGLTQTIGKYTRTISFVDVCRDVSDNITDCPGSYTDVQTKKVVVTVTWNTSQNVENIVQQITYLTNWDSQEWIQTDWSGGSGQSIWSDITMYESDDGNIDYSTSGEIKLVSLSGNGCGTNTWPFTTPANYTYNSSNIEVTGGLASLLDQGGASSCSGTPTTCNTYGDSGTCSAQDGCSWSAGGSGSTTNSGFNSNANGWTYSDWNQGGGEVDVTGSYVSTSGNPGGWVNVNIPIGKDDELGGYWTQSFVTTENNPTATVDFDWLISNYGATPNTFQLYVFVDNASGAPTIGQQVWSSGEITATQGWTSQTNIDIASKVLTSGTYYLKIAVWVETPGSNTGPFTIGYDNVVVNWSGTSSCSGTPTACNTYGDSGTCSAQDGCSWSAGVSYPTNEPSINPTTSFAPSSIDAWGSFTETATKNGGEIYYQLSDDDGTTWYFWDGGGWSTSVGATDYNISSDINTNISTFSTSTGQIMFKAFLESDGSQLVQLDEIKLSWGESTGGGGGYESNGYFLSSAFDTGILLCKVQVIEWDETQPSGSDIQVQIRTAPDSSGSPGTWSNWYGATGSGTYFTNPFGNLIPSSLNDNQWIQYRVELTGDSVDTPILQEIRINYK
ncbi:MAG: hypothetical protein A2725_04235 [Candidatus Magasanikbacteria bacterium RIFCSPHIGHO2_01_FULL_33_34]|uniref:Uncharacterized protein n=1 Tax=Candidatus Magasanikbacteria bacterium RIFCSPHIGHO2_01_FULL_33_34 TaxID=1798671 RepID=A0A1F6LHP8_9BACT|nr:MAG: hypothetical protein A2725_04235 [Candidatus Magasanikbacteria bacterium RIFCSPHIGHO2_01_FULL_33_34]OGH65174.1 MAG: hypothetical protein A3B83_03995 [Candidatus Magasanikbacteria bacterium RIFCSPHIGHO2_02_FULL_33_17]OGH75281.1 MAG: hypothetical protein A3A89_04170 [Candidatus Magasanikbacteria bacterium RIFCSPLOWO2_01_FULL_33_34]OGH81036.1 MAG: hypothetical protein A3F93_00200 [Candidatus Magasanikbacteria bacterium RIFCSPLOWO2_12_FULL_34_7]